MMLSGKNHYESETEIKELQNVIDYTVKFKYLEISLPLWPYIKFEHLYSELRKCHDWIFPRLTDITIMSYYTVKIESYYRCLYLSPIIVLYYNVISYLRQVERGKKPFLLLMHFNLWTLVRKSWFECCFGRKVSLIIARWLLFRPNISFCNRR